MPRKIDTLLWIERLGNKVLPRYFLSKASTKMRSSLEVRGMLDVSIVLDGCISHREPRDCHRLSQLAQGSLDALALRLWREHLDPGVNALDVGAYLGVYPLTQLEQSDRRAGYGQSSPIRSPGVS